MFSDIFLYLFLSSFTTIIKGVGWVCSHPDHLLLYSPCLWFLQKLISVLTFHVSFPFYMSGIHYRVWVSWRLTVGSQSETARSCFAGVQHSFFFLYKPWPTKIKENTPGTFKEKLILIFFTDYWQEWCWEYLSVLLFFLAECKALVHLKEGKAQRKVRGEEEEQKTETPREVKSRKAETNRKEKICVNHRHRQRSCDAESRYVDKKW